MEATETAKPKSKRGFASMSLERVREIAAKGGKSVPKDKRSFSVNKELAISSGKKGGSTKKKRKFTA
jgi:general stress protein YciG